MIMRVRIKDIYLNCTYKYVDNYGNHIIQFSEPKREYVGKILQVVQLNNHWVNYGGYYFALDWVEFISKD